MSKATEPTHQQMPQSKNSRVCVKNVKMIWERIFKIQIFTSCLLEFVFSDCLLQKTKFDNCDKLCSVESILDTYCVEWWPCNEDFYLSEEGIKIFINKEYYCQMRRIMIGKLWNIKHAPKENCYYCSIILSKYVQSCTTNCKGVKTMALWMCSRGAVRGNIKPIINN